MNEEQTAAFPIFAVSDEAGRELHLVLSVSTFRAENGEAKEGLLPIVEGALNLAQQRSGTDTLISFYLHAAAGEVVVRRVRNVMKQAFETERPVLWIRADTEQYLKAALNVAQVDYPQVVVITPGKQEVAV
jgi:glycosyltransferase A (GT-A) superfamily protein (DUF2064 family)